MDVFEIDENKLYKTATWLGVGLRCLTPLSTIFQLFRDGLKGSFNYVIL